MRALGIDFGTRRIGLALSDSDGDFASAWEVYARKGADDASELVRRALEKGVDTIVVGLPLELDGSKGQKARMTLRFVERMKAVVEAAESTLEIVTWDERFSTFAAERTLQEANLSRGKRKEKIDALAAQFFLQGWLDYQKEQQKKSREESEES